MAEVSGGSSPVVAFASVWRAADHWYLHNLFVAPGHQRGGIGRGLLQHVLGEIGRPVELKTDGPNLAARRLYQTCGFRDVGEGSSGEVPWVRMRLG